MSRNKIEMNPLAVIRRANVLALMEYHNVTRQDLTKGTKLSSTTVLTNFGDETTTSRIRPASNHTIDIVCTYFKLWPGALDVRAFDPEATPLPHTSLSLTINVKNIDDLQMRKFKKLLDKLGDLVDG